MQIKQTITTAVLATLLCVVSALSQEHAKVVITNNKFEPKELTIKAGSEVIWENKEGTHAVTADDGSWTSSGLTAGKTYTRKFDKPGKYAYYCTFHGGKGGHQMSGVINVTD